MFDGNAPGADDVFAVGTGTDRTRREAVATPAEEETGAVSPNGRWIAYGSGESGQWQVYVRPFMAPGGRWLISTGPAGTPLWTSDTEVVYVDYPTQTLIAATLEFGSAVRVTERRQLFGWDAYAFNESTPQYDVARDGQSFLPLRSESAGSMQVEAIVVLNWFTEIERRMAAQGGR